MPDKQENLFSETREKRRSSEEPISDASSLYDELFADRKPMREHESRPQVKHPADIAGDIELPVLNLDPNKNKSDSSRIERNTGGQIERIYYPDGKSSKFFERDKDGNLNAIVSKHGENTRRFEKEGQHWYYSVSGMKLPLPGEITVNDKGDVSSNLGNGIWQTEKADGSIVSEKSNAAGARFSLDRQGRTESISRKDGSSLQLCYKGNTLSKIIENEAGKSTPVSWTRSGESWVADSSPPQTRKNLELTENGNLKYLAADGQTHIRRSSGAEIIEKENSAKLHFDSQGRISEIKYPDSKRISLKYDEQSEQVKSLSIEDGKKSKTYTRLDGDNWSISDERGKKVAVWQGELSLADDGTISNKTNGKGQAPLEMGKVGAKPDNTEWISKRTDGTLVRERLGADNSRISFDKENRPVLVKSKDGKTIELSYENGQLSRLSQSSPDSNQIVSWTKQGDKSFKSDSSRYPESRKDLSVSKDGELSYTSTDGNKHVEKLDGSSTLYKRDGSKIEIDKLGLTRKITGPAGQSRSIEYDENGKINRIIESDKAGNSASRQSDGTNDSRQNLRVTPLGDIIYQSADGKTVVEKSNFSKISVRPDGKVSELVQQNGSSRSFSYDQNNQLNSITDTRKSDKGINTETWSSVQNADGTPSDRFVSKGPDGKERFRYAVKVAANGDYEYKTSDGKSHKAQADALQSGYGSADVYEARVRLEELSKAQNMNTARFAKFMDEFEKRCKTSTDSNMKAPSEEAIVKTYDNLAKLLQGGEKSYMNDKQRAKLCEQTMHNIAFPKNIDQGQNPTCNITTGEIYTASRRPEAYSNLVEQIANTGKYDYKDSQGRTRSVRPPRSGVLPGNEEASFDINHPHENVRNWASKVVQVTAVNTIEPGYTSGIPMGAHIEGIIKMTRNISGDKMPYTGYGPSGEARAVKEATLIQLKQSGNLPCGVVTLGGSHVQVIHDVKIENGRVKSLWLGNQWGKQSDPGWISMSKLHNIQFSGGGW